MPLGGGTAIKCSDAYTCPLCTRCHRFWHDRAYLPCFEWRVDGVEQTHAANEAGFHIAHANSLALMHKAQALLLGSEVERMTAALQGGAIGG